MAKRNIKLCPVTGLPIQDRKYNRSAKYSKEGFKQHRKKYAEEYNRQYYVAKQMIGIGLLAKGETNGNRNNASLGPGEVREINQSQGERTSGRLG